MEKQASPYKTHSYNNIKVFFSVILSSIFMVTSDLEGSLVHVAQSNYNISSCVCMYCMISVLNVQEYIKVLLRWASSTTKHPHAHSPNSNVICLLFFCNSTHINNNSTYKKQNTVKCPEQGMTDEWRNGDEEDITRNAVEYVPCAIQGMHSLTHFLTFIPFFSSLLPFRDSHYTYK